MISKDTRVVPKLTARLVSLLIASPKALELACWGLLPGEVSCLVLNRLSVGPAIGWGISGLLPVDRLLGKRFWFCLWDRPYQKIWAIHKMNTSKLKIKSMSMTLPFCRQLLTGGAVSFLSSGPVVKRALSVGDNRNIPVIIENLPERPLVE